MKEKQIHHLKNGISLSSDFYDNKEKKGIFLFPGFTEHKQSLDSIAKKLSSEYKTWTFDLNSQGESTGNWNIKEMQESAYLAIKKIQKEHDLKKIGGFGNCVGGTFLGVLSAQDPEIIDCLCLTSTPAGLQDVLPSQALNILKYIPQSFLRQGTIMFDKIMTKTNTNYKQKTHLQFKKNNKYQKHAQIGATKITNIKNIINAVKNAPRLEDYAQQTTQPILLIYGGEDTDVVKIKNGILPKNVRNMYDKINTTNKHLLIIPGADHSLNEKTKMDDNFNQDKKYEFIKEEIKKHYQTYM